MSQRTYSQYTQDYDTSSQSFKKSKSYKKVQKHKPKASMSAGSIAKVVRRELYKNSETKHCNLAGNEVAISTINTGTGLVFISQPYPTVGAEPTQRVGNKIQPVGYSFKAVYNNNNDIPIVIRRIILQVEDGENTNNDILNNLFEGNSNNVDTYDTGTMDSLIRKVNREGFKVLKDDIIKLGTNNGGQRYEVDKLFVKLGGSQTYRESASTHAVNDRIVCIHIARQSDADESLGSTVEMSYLVDFYFKDL